MNARELSQILVEDTGPHLLGPKASAFANRLLLRINSIPALQAALTDIASYLKQPETEEETLVIELGFKRLPKEIMPEVLRLIAAPKSENVQVVHYVQNEAAHTGFIVSIKTSELAGNAFAYAS